MPQSADSTVESVASFTRIDPDARPTRLDLDPRSPWSAVQ
jgi:hypothetical protein